MNSKIKTTVFFLLCFTLIAAVWGYGSGSLYGPVLFSDEFGYWAGAAWMLGKDWGQVASVGYYYSFGYSFLLLPCFAAQPVTAYRLGTACNVVYLCLALLALYRLMGKLCSEKGGKRAVFYCFMAVCCPGVLFYMQLTLPEVLLSALIPLTALGLYRELEKPRIGNAVFLGVCFSFLYFVHMRTVGFLAAAGLMLAAVSIRDRERRKNLLVFCVTAGALFLAGYAVKNALTKDFYRFASAELLAVNDYSGQLQKIAGLLSAEGLERLFMSVLGKLFYLGSESFGLFYLGMGYLWKRARGFCLPNRFGPSGGVSFYLFTGILLQIGISALFTVSCERIDYLLYGRYNEVFLPAVAALGMVELASVSSVRRFRNWAVYTAAQGVAAACLASFIERREITQVYGYFITGISYALDGSDIAGAGAIWLVCAAGGAVSAAAVGLFAAAGKKNGGKISCVLAGMLAALWIGIALRASGLYIYPHNRENREDIRLCEQLSTFDGEDRRICFLNSPGVAYIDLLQYMLRDISIQVLEGEAGREELTPDAAVLIYADRKDREALEEEYGESVETPHFILFYND